jgi:hypothetical protein
VVVVASDVDGAVVVTAGCRAAGRGLQLQLQAPVPSCFLLPAPSAPRPQWPFCFCPNWGAGQQVNGTRAVVHWPLGSGVRSRGGAAAPCMRMPRTAYLVITSRGAVLTPNALHRICRGPNHGSDPPPPPAGEQRRAAGNDRESNGNKARGETEKKRARRPQGAIASSEKGIVEEKNGDPDQRGCSTPK